mmetsp:Transcript_8241/g.24270  ORF Transcript_8241/g.24270 Transcript_8241/m.24270 type:complete len:224 (-) Transcript_8241:111-782(-)
MGWSVWRGKRRWCAEASVSRRSVACPSAAFTSAQSTCTEGRRPSRRPLMVPKGPSNQMSKTSSSTLVAFSRLSSCLQWARSCSAVRASSAASCADSMAALCAAAMSVAWASSSMRSRARAARASSVSACSLNKLFSLSSSSASSRAALACSRSTAGRLNVSAELRFSSSSRVCRRSRFWFSSSRVRFSKSPSTKAAQSEHRGTSRLSSSRPLLRPRRTPVCVT